MKAIDFKGIVRAAAAQNNADGNCEEIINLRQETGAWRVVGKKKNILKEVDYEQVYVHKYGTFENYIGVKAGKAVWFACAEGDKVSAKAQELCPVAGKVAFVRFNNILLLKDDNYIGKAVFDGNKYQAVMNELPDIAGMRFDVENGPDLKPSDYVRLDYHQNSNAETDAAKETIRGMVNKFKAENPGLYEGRVWVCTSYQLFDGSETKLSAPQCIEMGKYVPGIIRARRIESHNDTSQFIAEIRVKGMILCKFSLTQLGGLDAKYTDLVSAINVYVTPIYSFYDTDHIDLGRFIKDETDITNLKEFMIPRCVLQKEEVQKMLFYRVASLAPDDYRYIKVDFNALTANPTMTVDVSGWWNTVGEMFVYNNRLHLHNVTQRFAASNLLGRSWSMAYDNLWSAVEAGGYSYRPMVAFVYLKVNKKDVVMRYEFEGACAGGSTIRFPETVAFPDARAYKIVFYDKANACTPFTVKLNEFSTFNMAFGILDNVRVQMNWTSQPATFPQTSDFYEDNTNLIVSEATNPYYFPPQHSYLMPGEIINLAVNTEQISTSQVGMYPLYAFTTEGVYALQVGDGNILYSNVIPISAEVAVKGSDVLQTKYGILFVTESGLKLIAGSTVTDLSKPIDGQIDLAIRDNEEYPFYTAHEQLYNIRPYLSQLPFVEYIRAAEMGYDISHDELIVSNPEYEYTYVCNLETQAWHKITERYSFFDRHMGLRKGIKEIPALAATAEIEFNSNGAVPAGEEVGVSIGAKKFTYTTLGGERLRMISTALAKEIGSYYSVKAVSNYLLIDAVPGAAGNRTFIEVHPSANVSLDLRPFYGGKDARLVPVLDLCDIRIEEKCPLPVHLQTRPVSMDSHGFKTIAHAALRGEICPAGKRYGAYLFASNDLRHWEMVSAEQVAETMPGIPMRRTGKSFRYFIFVTGGEVMPEHSIVCLEVEGDQRWDNRLR